MNVLLTGYPRVGKTTVIQKVIEKIDKPIAGFFTEEIRDDRKKRVGFLVRGISTKKEETLAHVNLPKTRRVAKYGVSVENFEEVALEEMKKERKKLIIIDEIGKMELFSKKFKEELLQLLEQGKVLGTITMRGGGQFVRNIKKRKDVELLTVTKENRNNLPSKILQLLQEK
jgi:nucleoside-triphosphatase